ncbi:MAG TPA: hypothetical protein PKK00_06880 [Bacteroidales bacterium]|nr:hypothetical protein [Bacteroidales bacterium]HPS17040.1 hypothetical protein [Bacteroidales bacterium]
MKTKYFIIIFLLITAASISTLTVSCKKNKNVITINGHIFNPYSNQYVENATIIISSSKITSGFYNSNYTDIATTTSDASGAFSFEFDQEKSSGYRFYIYKENYFDRTIDIADADIQPENTYTPTFELYSEGYLKLHVKNSSPFNDNDFIGYSYNDIDEINCATCCSNTVFKGYGKTYDTTYKCKTYGSKDVKINWHVTKFGSDVAFSDTLFCNPFDTTYYEILY